MTNETPRLLRITRPLWIRFVLGRPALLATVIVSLTAAALAMVWLTLTVDADVANVVRGNTQASVLFERLETDFGRPSRDEILVVRAEDLGEPQTFQALEDLLINLQLTPSIEGILSVFSIPDPGGDGESFLARRDLQHLSPSERLQALSSQSPLAASFIANSMETTIIVVLPDHSFPIDTRLDDLSSLLADADPLLDISVHGISAFNRQAGAALIKDQIVLIPAGLLVCLFGALILFRSWRAAIVCGTAPVLSLIWVFALMGATGTPFSPFMAAVPVVLLVLGVADSVHLFSAVLRASSSNRLDDALALALEDLLPAIALTNGTTALAFLSLLLHWHSLLFVALEV